MNMFKVIKKWFKKDDGTDLKRVRVTSSGAFYMKSEDLFHDSKKTLELIEKLDKSIANYMKRKSRNLDSAV